MSFELISEAEFYVSSVGTEILDFILSSKRAEVCLSIGTDFRLALMPARRELRELLLVSCSLNYILFDYNVDCSS